VNWHRQIFPHRDVSRDSTFARGEERVQLSSGIAGQQLLLHFTVSGDFYTIPMQQFSLNL